MNFGDGWEHIIKLEKRVAPFEDCGGISLYKGDP